MAEHMLSLNMPLKKVDQTDALSGVAESILQLLIEADVEGLIHASLHERSAGRRNFRNGYRKRILITRLGSLTLRVPKLRRGTYRPPFLKDSTITEMVLFAAIREARMGGVSIQQVSDLVQAMGLKGISKSKIALLCKEIDVRARAFLGRTIAHLLLLPSLFS